MDNKAGQHQYFPNLDGLRFLGALMLILLHIEGIKGIHNQPLVGFIYRFFKEGNLFVSLFFVLSGFLITYLLLQEKRESKTISLKKFYTRRLLRIWPLYYLVGIVGFFILPLVIQNFFGQYSLGILNRLWFCFLLYILFIPFLGEHQAIGATWSVRVEEAFYLIWPLIIKNTKNYIMVFFVVIISVVMLRNVAAVLLLKMPTLPLLKFIDHQVKDYRVSCMAIGGLGAYIYNINSQVLLSFLYKKYTQLAIYVLTGFFLFFKVRIPFINVEVYSVLFACIVLNLATNPDTLIRLDYGWMNYLGKISYGLYMYNPIMRIFCLQVTLHVFSGSVAGLEANLFLYATTILSTIGVSVLSFELFEKWFLKLKRRVA